MNQNGSGGGVGGGGSVYGRMGGPYDRWVDPTDRSPLGRVQQQYWTTKQTLMRKLGKKEDEHVVASDSELDAKLEMYSSIDETCLDLDRLLGFYQDQLCVLSQEENSLGRFLKEQGKEDKTRAGKMMVAVGKTMSYTAQQRLALRSPLLRLHQEVETFHNRAVKDTAQTVRTMEKVRTEYRGTLLWMKDISQELDPDTYKQLEKFRKVQMQVKKNKQRFDKLKVDCLQKIDLLAASRCNMFSHALVLYQDALLQFWEKTARTMNHVAESFKGYQYYEFSVIKELCEPSRQLADRTSSSRPAPAQPAVGAAAAAPAEQDGDKLISLDLDQPDDDAETDAPPSRACGTLREHRNRHRAAGTNCRTCSVVCPWAEAPSTSPRRSCPLSCLAQEVEVRPASHRWQHQQEPPLRPPLLPKDPYPSRNLRRINKRTCRRGTACSPTWTRWPTRTLSERKRERRTATASHSGVQTPAHTHTNTPPGPPGRPARHWVADNLVRVGDGWRVSRFAGAYPRRLV
ncbi:islet cell autoantigen 1-like isoform X2 [Amphibalanus amphitrite]|uniref:islet cell autoantigen 1-like isoform X2 n=1 Tax=Amphibalanus amphitrite TaxID=1232801 RepID=UPI001C914B42|nr:islet cell autoantigen 1-like isoform X2 [Amphibalanus amphitrite]